jgi:hypothetical protein
MIDDALIEKFKTYIKDNYAAQEKKTPYVGLLSWSHVLLRPRQITPSFETLTDNMNRYIKRKRNTITFTVLLEKFRTERGVTPPRLYEGAWMDRRLYSRIMGNRYYHPQKNNVIALGLSLRLSREEMDRLLNAAGYSLNDSSISDLAVMYFLENQIYNIYDVNALLVSIGQKVLCRE